MSANLQPAPEPRHELAGTEMSCADIIIQVLADEGVNTVFGYSGGAILPTYDAVFRFNERREATEQMQLIVPANEQGAGFMAAGYARSTGKVGFSLVTSGPGATNSVTPIRDCFADSVPVVLVCGQVPRAAIGTDAFQEAPVFNIMTACAKHVFLVTDENQLEATVRSAFDIARSGRPGPVVIDVPKDLQNAIVPFKGAGLLQLRGYDERQAERRQVTITEPEAKAFFRLLSRSERPLIYAGGGVISSGAAEALQEFSERFRIPVVTTVMGIGAVDTTTDLSMHMLGMHGTAYANYAVEDCDLVFAVGARFDDRVCAKPLEWAPNAKVAHLDIDSSEIRKVKKGIDWAHVADARKALVELTRAGKDFQKDFSRWHAHLADLRREHAMNWNRDSPLLQPQEVLSILNDLVKGEAIYTTGVGQHQMWAAQFLDAKHPRTFLTSGSMGTMGFGLPAAIGAQVANPGTLVIDIDGDGSIRMNLGELETLTTYEIPVKVLLLNNLGDGMVRQWQDMFFDNRYSGTDKTLHKKDFIRAAEADGFQFAKRIRTREEAPAALQEFVSHPGPAILEAMIDPNAHVYPMIGPGMGYKEMITGNFIKARVNPSATDPTKVDPSSMF